MRRTLFAPALVRGALPRSQTSSFGLIRGTSSSSTSVGSFASRYAVNASQLYHTSLPQYARVAVAEAEEVVVEVSEKKTQKRKKSVAEMTPEEYDAYEQENKRKAEELKNAVGKMKIREYFQRIRHLFYLRKPPRVSHLHLLIKKIKKREHIQYAVKLLKYYQAFLIETNPETARLLLEAGLRTQRVGRIMHLFGTPTQYRLWPTLEACEVALDYFLERKSFKGAVGVLNALKNRKDLNPTKEMVDKVFNGCIQSGRPMSALATANVARIALELPAWEPHVYDKLIELFWARKAPGYVLRIHKQREADGVPTSRQTASTASWALLSQGKAEEAAKVFGRHLDQEKGGRGRALHSFVCGCIDYQDRFKVPFDEFAKLLPNFTSYPNAASAQLLWDKEVKNREVVKKEPQGEKKPNEWILKKREETKLKKERKAQMEENRKAKLAKKLERIKIMKRNNRRNKRRRLKEKAKQKKEEEVIPDSRTEARRTVRLDPKVKAILDAKRKELMAAAGAPAGGDKKKAPPKKKD